METNFELSRSLIKEATSFKDKDLEKAIQLIIEAIKICPEEVLEDKFKLSSYFHKAGEKVKSYDILFELLLKISNTTSLPLINMTKAQIYEKICVLKYNDQLFNDYIYYFSLYRYNLNMAIYMQGRKVDYIRTKDNFDMFGLSYHSKIKSVFKKIDCENNMELYSTLFSNFFNKNIDNLLAILEKSYLASMSKDYRLDIFETTGEREDRILKSDKQFMELIYKVDEKIFCNYFDENLKKLVIKNEKI